MTKFYYNIAKEAAEILYIYTGLSQNEKLRVCALAMKKLLAEGKKVMAIVPDQFSFDFDKTLYSHLGAKDFNAVTVYSFKRLSEALLECFGTEGTLLSYAERTVIIYLALKKVKAKKSLRLMSRFLEKPTFAGEISRIIDSLRRFGASTLQLKTASEKIGGTLGDKLFDIAEIYSEYLDLLQERLLRDESSIISEGATIALNNRYFKGIYVFIDRFDSFSPDELLLIKAAIQDAESVTVNLCMPLVPEKSAVSPFLHCQMTQNALIKLCSETNKGVRYYECKVPKTGNELINGIGSCLYTPIKKRFPADDSLEIYRADNIYEEAELVAAMIRRLVTQDGYCFNDIAVITHDIGSYSQALESAFERYQIEAFIDRTQPASKMAITAFMLDAIEAAATRKPDTDKILKYLRSPFSPLDYEETSVLWDYCVRWNVEGEMWLSPFTAGDSSKAEEVRKKVILPLKTLHDETKSGDAKVVASSFCNFLKAIDAGEHAFSVIENCVDSDMKLETARLFKQLWTAVMNAVSSIYLTAGAEKLTLKEFGELLRLILSETSVSNPPQKLDCVTVADVERSVIKSPKIAFVVGLADGHFPLESKKTSMFSGRDLKKLNEEGLAFEMTPEARLLSERFNCYNALSAPTQRLFLSWAGSDLRGRELRPSRFIRRIKEYSGAEIRSAGSIGIKTLCSTPAAAYYSLAVSRGLTEFERAALKEALDTTEYASKVNQINEYSSASHHLSPLISRKLFAVNNINVTASRIDVYNRCNYEYFCKYGLKIEPIKPIDIDPANRGTVMHYLFESVLRYFGNDFSDADDSEIRAKVDELLKSFSNDFLGGDFGKSAKFKADYSRLADAAMEILLNMREEFKLSKFRPERFEYDLSQKNGESALSLRLSSGLKLNIRGIVDRIDTYSDEIGQRYIRVIDYKTGEKKFSFTDIYNGINLQLLLYMLALTEGKDADFKDCKPAGILYMRAGFLECEAEEDPLSAEQKTRLERSAEQLKRNGLIISDPNIIRAMDETLCGLFIPVKMTSKGTIDKRSQTISENSFRLLEDYAKNKALRFGEDLLLGKIDAVPLGKDPEHLRCAYCDYSSVCDRKKYLYRLLSNKDGEALKAMISEEGENE